MIKKNNSIVSLPAQDFRLTNDELAKAINVNMRTLNEHHIKYNAEILKATEKHYIALIAEELRRAQIDKS